MPTPLRVLVLEDRPADAELMVHELRRAGFDPDWRRVETEPDYLAHLDPALDVILADYRLPGFTALTALRHLQDRGLDIPFIIITGTLGDEEAVECVKQGAADYLLKDRMARLGTAVARALEEKQRLAEHKREEAALLKLSRAVEQAADHIFITNRDGVIEYVNPAFENHTGYAKAEMLGQTPRILKSGKHEPRFYERLWQRVLAGQVFRGVFINRKKNGDLYYEEKTITPLKDAQGSITHFVSTGCDITERQRAEEALLASEARFAGILDIAEDAIISVDETQHIKLFNKGAEKIFGYAGQEVLGQPLDVLLPLRFVETHRQNILGFAVSTDAARRMGERKEIFGRRKDGTEFPAEASISKLKLENTTIFTVMLRDITERKSLEQQLRQSQKIEAIGRLTGGIAHDFNNLLTVINGYSEMLLQTLPAGDLQRDNVVQIREAGERAASLTRQLLAFSRRQILAPVVLDLNATVTNMDKMLRRVIGEDIDLMPALKPGLGHVKADPGQIEQVILNLAVNARDAMPKGGKLTIETADVELDEDYARQHVGARTGPHVMLAVSDTGVGMDAETQAHIFEPFFTTKEQGKGTGLGLATVYGIVKQSGGSIWAYSEVGRGATFKIFLPRVNEATESRGPCEEVAQTLRGAETILLVEDDTGVRALARAILQGNGYTVLEASNGAAAIQVFTAHKGTVHLIISDVIMPLLSGREMAASLVAANPDVKVLFISGYTDDAVVRHGVLERGIPFLQKPFTPNSLLRKVREALDAS